MKKALTILMILSLLLCCAPAFAADSTDGSSPEEESAADLTSLVLDALDSEVYRSTYEALLDGEPIRSGSYGDAAIGLQQTLADFGQKIGIDGSAGSQTISTLKAVQANFGLEQTDTLDAEGYALLLPRLLAVRDFDAAYGLLCDTMEESELDYLRACSLAMQKKFYSAKRAFEYSGFGNWEERAAACVQPWPSGVLYTNPSAGGGTAQLIIEYSAGGGEAMLVKVYNDDGDLVRILFTGTAGTVATSLDDGSYMLEIEVGTDWYGEEEGFGDDASYTDSTYIELEPYHWTKFFMD